LLEKSSQLLTKFGAEIGVAAPSFAPNARLLRAEKLPSVVLLLVESGVAPARATTLSGREGKHPKSPPYYLELDPRGAMVPS